MSKHFIHALMGLSAVAMVGCTDDTNPTGGTGDTDVETLAGNAVVEPCDIDFGQLEGGQTGSQFVNVNNTGLGLLTILTVEVGEPFSTSFTGGDGSGIPVQPDGLNQFRVNFEPGPDDYGLSTSELVITTDDPDQPSIVCTVQGSVTDDADLDGFAAAAAGGDDCDDSDPDINPGVEEIWYDGIDQDCAGDSDFDQDGDGYEARVYFPDDTELNPETNLPGGDCQDVDPTINPGEEEIWYDGKDADCDGQNDFDQDGDGYRTAEFGYSDCNDLDPDANPEAVEAFNGFDDDCNGLVDDKASPTRADIIGIGDDPDWSAGRGIGVDDVDGTGKADVIVGCHYYEKSSTGATSGDGRGGVAIFYDGMGDEDLICDGDEDLLLAGENATDELGYEVITLPDFFGDGNADIAATAVAQSGWAGAVYLFDSNTLGPATTTSDYAIKISGLTNYQLGSGLGTGDMNGDGLSDLIMHGGHRTQNFTYTALQYGSDRGLGDYAWTDIDATFVDKCGGEPISSSYIRSCGDEVTTWVGGDTGARDRFDTNGHAPADFDGDGYDDFIVGDAWADTSGTTDSGTAWVLFGRRTEHTSSNADYSESMTVMAEGAVRDGALGGGVGFMPDIDGDGADEILIHDDDTSTLYLLGGGSYLRAGEMDLEQDSRAIFRGVAMFSSMVNAGDWTGDGVGDVVLTFADSATSGGELYLLPSNEWEGEYDFEEASSGSIIGGDNNYQFGIGAPIYTSDIDGNGTADLVIGDPFYDDPVTSKEETDGAVFTFFNMNE